METRGGFSRTRIYILPKHRDQKEHLGGKAGGCARPFVYPFVYPFRLRRGAVCVGCRCKLLSHSDFGVPGLSVAGLLQPPAFFLLFDAHFAALSDLTYSRTLRHGSTKKAGAPPPHPVLARPPCRARCGRPWRADEVAPPNVIVSVSCCCLRNEKPNRCARSSTRIPRPRTCASRGARGATAQEVCYARCFTTAKGRGLQTCGIATGCALPLVSLDACCGRGDGRALRSNPSLLFPTPHSHAVSSHAFPGGHRTAHPHDP